MAVPVPKSTLQSQTDSPHSSNKKSFVTQASQTECEATEKEIFSSLESSKLLSSKSSNMEAADQSTSHPSVSTTSPFEFEDVEPKRRFLLEDPPSIKRAGKGPQAPSCPSLKENEPVLPHEKENDETTSNRENESTNSTTNPVTNNQDAWINVARKTKILRNPSYNAVNTQNHEGTNNSLRVRLHSPINVRDAYRRRQCLLIHDGTFEGFEQNRFSRQLEVKEYLSPSITNMAADEKIKELIAKDKPECVFIHVGNKDAKVRQNLTRVKHDLESIMYYLLEKTTTNICFSTIITTANNEEFNKHASAINTLIETMVSHARDVNVLNRPCLFTYNNNSVREHNKLQVNELKLSVVGKLIMWKRLDDGLRKTLRMRRKETSQGRNLNTNTQRSFQYV